MDYNTVWVALSIFFDPNFCSLCKLIFGNSTNFTSIIMNYSTISTVNTMMCDSYAIKIERCKYMIALCHVLYLLQTYLIIVGIYNTWNSITTGSLHQVITKLIEYYLKTYLTPYLPFKTPSALFSVPLRLCEKKLFLIHLKPPTSHPQTVR